MLELMSVMEALYPEGIGWQLWKVRPPKDILKKFKTVITSYSFLSSVLKKLRRSFFFLSLLFSIPTFLHFYFARRLKGYVLALITRVRFRFVPRF